MNFSDSLEGIFSAAEELGCEVRRNEPLNGYTSFRIGGVCDGVIVLDSEEACCRLPMKCRSEGVPFHIFGKGTNLIVSDGRISGIVFVFGSSLSEMSVRGNIVSAGAGASFTRLAVTAMEHGLSGLEFAYGIPGSVGGAVFMNAGAYGGEVKDVIISVRAVCSDGTVREFGSDELEMSYRKSIFSESDMMIISAEFALSSGDKSVIKAKMDDLMSRRREKQPLEYPSAGSTFKRPEGSYASLLIDQCGLKGRSVGGAEVSTKHAGFIVNKGGATFSDLMELIDTVKKEVYDKTGYSLECEPVIIK